MVSFAKFLELAVASGLVSQRRLDAVLAEFRMATKAEQGGAGDLPQLLEWLVSRKVLTRWQCQKLLEGKYKGFSIGKYLLLDHLATSAGSSKYLVLDTNSQEPFELIVAPPSKQVIYLVIRPGSLVDEDVGDI